MLFIIAIAIITVVCLGITFFLTDRSRWRKVLLALGIFGAVLSSLQAYKNRERADDLARKQEYANVARYNALGLLGMAGAGLAETSPLNKIIGNYVHDDPNNFRFDCTPAAMNAYNVAVALDSKFPFSYYYRGSCYNLNNVEGGQHDLDTAHRVLLITTEIPGHHPHHDDILNFINTGRGLRRMP